MYKLMIVEDEMFIRIGLEHAFDWTTLGIETVPSASNGREALELYQVNRANIIITDLKMPLMSGMELIEEIRKTNKDVKFIILTCVEDFQTAKQALHNSVSYYFTKYDLKLDDLRECITKLCTDLDTETAIMQTSDKLPKANSTSIKDYLFSESNENEDLILQYRHDGGMYKLAILSYSEKYGDEGKIRAVVSELLRPYPCVQLLTIYESSIVLIANAVSAEALDEALDDTAEHLSNMLYTYFNFNCTVFYSKKYTEIYESKKILAQACGYKHLKFFLPNEKSFSAALDYVETLSERVEYELRRVVEFYRTQFGEEYTASFSSFSSRFLEATVSISDAEDIKGLFMQWGNLLVSLLYLVNNSADYQSAELRCMLDGADSFEKMCGAFMEYMTIVQSKGGGSANISSGLMMATQYIREHLSEEVSLPAVAKHVSFAPGYLSYLFKHELNMSFTNFILKMRIKNAKLLLAQTDQHLYEISALTGFNNSSYFNKAFKRMTGITPSQYRKVNRGGKHEK